MSLRPFFSFYGGKWRATPRYPRPESDMIIEPFAGSAGYSVRHNAHDVFLYDIDERVIGTWQYLIRASEREIHALPLLKPGQDVREFPIIEEARWLIGWWLNKGMTAPCHIPSRWMREPLPGRDETYWGEGVRDRLARQVSKIRHWRAALASYEDVPDYAATWFIDPPYIATPGARYTHSNAAIDFANLAAWCRERQGQVIVCENVGADWLPFEPFMIAKASVGNGRAGVSHEAIWTNRALDMSLGDDSVEAMTESDADRSKQIVERDAATRARVFEAACLPILTSDYYNEDAIVESLGGAMMALVDAWREDAAWWEKSGRRGGIGAAKELRNAAARLAGFAVGLKAVAKFEQPEIAQPEPTPARGTFPAAPESSGDPTMDFLTGKTNTYEPKSQASSATVLAELTTEATITPPIPSVPAAVDNVFTSPGAPGAGKRPAVSPLPYAALPILATRPMGRDHVSHSYVSSYEQCSLSALLSDASKAGLIGARRPSWSLVGGNALHAAIEEYERRELSGVLHPDVAEAWNYHLNIHVADTIADLAGSPYFDPATWHEANGGREGYDWWRVEGEAMLKRYITFHDEAWRETRRVLAMPDQTLALEVPYEMTVRSLDGTTGFTSKGKIDAVWIEPASNEITIIDYKSGRNAPTETFQLGEYGHALAMLLLGQVSAHKILGRYWLARKGEYTPPIDLLETHPIEELQYRYEAAMRGTKAGVFAPHPNPLCISCGVRDYCPASPK